MQQPFRISHWALVLAAVVSFLQPLATPGASPVPRGSQIYIGHASHMTALIPASWRVPVSHSADYAGDDGFVLSFGIADNGTGDACAAYRSSILPNWVTRVSNLTEFTAESTTWRDKPACQLAGTMHGMAKGLVIPLPESFDSFGMTIGYGVFLTDADHFDHIAATLDLTDERLTPETYLSSVIDIIEARAWWAPDVDWELSRTLLLRNIDALQDYHLAAGSIQSVLSLLHGQGDRHSFIPSGVPGDAHGLGMIVGGQQVLSVFPDGPADRAGLQPGDVIEELNGFPLPGDLILEQFGLGVWPAESQLTVQRPGQAASFEVTVTKGPYTTFLPPTGERLGGDLGYIEIDQFTAMGRQGDYAEAGDTVLRAVDRPAVCGWIVDLRLNVGGGYPPMLSAVGAILGNGPFWGSVDREGTVSMVSYQDGAFVFGDGSTVPDYLSPGTRYVPAVSSPPIAVLTSPVTGSAGEVATVAFVGRSNTRLFGEHTAGLTVGNTGYVFWDGTQLALAEGAYVDRNGTVHTDGVTPDVAVATDWATFRTPDDPVIAAASAWLQQQPGCAASATPT